MSHANQKTVVQVMLMSIVILSPVWAQAEASFAPGPAGVDQLVKQLDRSGELVLAYLESKNPRDKALFLAHALRTTALAEIVHAETIMTHPTQDAAAQAFRQWLESHGTFVGAALELFATVERDGTFRPLQKRVLEWSFAQAREGAGRLSHRLSTQLNKGSGQIPRENGVALLSR